MDPVRLVVGVVQIALAVLASAIGVGFLSADQGTLAAIIAAQNAFSGGKRLNDARNGPPKLR